MKRLANLEMRKNPPSEYPLMYKDNKKFTTKAIKELVKLGKKKDKIKIFNDGKVRFSHRGLYFDYSPRTGNWIYTRSGGRRKWNSSKSVEDFFERMNVFCDWYDTNVRK